MPTKFETIMNTVVGPFMNNDKAVLLLLSIALAGWLGVGYLGIFTGQVPVVKPALAPPPVHSPKSAPKTPSPSPKIIEVPVIKEVPVEHDHKDWTPIIQGIVDKSSCGHNAEHHGGRNDC